MRACEQLQKFCEHEQASTNVIFASDWSKGQIFASTFNRVWKGIFGIRDLTRIRYENRENDKYIDGIRDLAVSREAALAQKMGTGCGIYVCVSVGNAGNRHERPKQINQASAKWCLLSNQTPYGVSG